MFQRFHRMAWLWALALPILAGGSTAAAEEFRGFWVDAWGAGLHNAAEVQTLLGTPGSASDRGQIRDANCNAVIVQVRRRADVCYPSGVGEPYMSGLSPSNFNALQAIIDAAHDTTGGKQRIEVHAWIVTFATTSSGNAPPSGSIYYQHNNPADPDNYWVTLSDSGAETDDRAFDPGHPRCLEYITNVCLDLVTRFDIDGLHFDYIRFTGSNQGYNPASIARYNERYGLTGQPAPSDEQFKQWRRDQVTAVVRRVYAHVQAVKPQVKQSASVVTWNPSPTSSTRAAFMNTRPYYDVFADWDAWMQEGILDMSVPMTYYNQASLPNDYQRWIDFQKDRKFNRHNIVGPGIYLNSLSNAILQLQKTRDTTSAGNRAQGFSGYSYRVPYNGGSWGGFAPTLLSQVTPTPDTIPDMPWKSAPTQGHMMGSVVYADGTTWADGASVSITGPENRTQTCDGTGFYAFIDLPPGTYTVIATKSGQGTAGANVSVSAGNMSAQNFQLSSGGAPQIANVQVAVTACNATVTWQTTTAADSQVRYGLGTYTATVSDDTDLTSHSLIVNGLAPETTYHFQVASANDSGSAQTSDATFTTNAIVTETTVDNLDSGWSNTSPSGAAWSAGSLGGVPKIGSNYLYASGVTSTSEASATRKCTWTPNLPIPGRYDVYAYYQTGTNRTTSAPFKVVYGGGEVTTVQNQYATGSNLGGWYLLGTNLPFQAGAGGYVQASNHTGNTALVSADAAKFVLLPDSTLPETPVVTDAGAWTSERTSLSAVWTSTDPESGLRGFEYRIVEVGGGIARDWTDAGLVAQITANGLALRAGGTYLFEVRAINNAGTASAVGTSDGILVFTFDVNGDHHVDSVDLADFLQCTNGAETPYPEETATDCGRFDTDGDGDVDQEDFGVFQRCLTGLLNPIDVSCVGTSQP